MIFHRVVAFLGRPLSMTGKNSDIGESSTGAVECRHGDRFSRPIARVVLGRHRSPSGKAPGPQGAGRTTRPHGRVRRTSRRADQIDAACLGRHGTRPRHRPWQDPFTPPHGEPGSRGHRRPGLAMASKDKGVSHRTTARRYCAHRAESRCPRPAPGTWP